MDRERILARPRQVVPRLGMRRRVDRLGDELVPRVRVDAALGRDRAEQRVEQEQARARPASRRGCRRRPRASCATRSRVPAPATTSATSRSVAASTPDSARRELERIARIELAQARFSNSSNVRRDAGLLGVEILLPVPPAAHELAVVASRLDQMVRDREQDRGLAARMRREPVVGVRRGVREPHVEHDDLRAGVLALDDPLRVRVEVVTGLEVRADQEDDVGVGVVGARAVEAHPERVAGAAARRADVRVGVVAVDAPRRQHALGVAVLAGTADVVHHVVRAVLDDRARGCAPRCRRAPRPRSRAPTCPRRARRRA